MGQADRYLDLPLEDVMGDRFSRYSKYIIQERALPDARDGLKPVQRRILYAMYHEGNTADKPYRKSAKTVGNVIGNYHPHGDSPVYEAMVRMSQDWKVRQLLIDMHGNNGSIDGDPPAAMRYTEARLSAISAELMRDLEKETVDYIPNFDDSTSEPVVLPAMFPNLLVNGATGISAGYATDIPPHHLGEIIDGIIFLMKKPNATLDDMLTIVKGPDFPTGGIVQGADGIKQAYETGKGKVVVRAKTAIETVRGGREQIVITELPYEIVKASLVKKMDEIRFDKKVDGIAEVRDETDRAGLRIVVELKRDADSEAILHYLLKHTDLQMTYHFNMVAIYNQKPQLMGLLPLMRVYIAHQKEVFTRRSQFELEKAKKRAHIVEGLIKAVSVLDDVIRTIRASRDKKDAKDNLMMAFGFTDMQAEAIVNLQLYRLTNTDIATLQEEAAQLSAQIAELEAILASEQQLIALITKEMKALKKKFVTPRRTEIKAEVETLQVNMDMLIASENVRVTVTEAGYVKRTGLRSYSAGSKDAPGMKEGDRVLFCREANTTDTLLLFTKKGFYLYVPIHQLPDIRWKEDGQHIANLVPLESEDEVIDAWAVDDFEKETFLIFVTRGGMIKRSALALYESQRYTKPRIALNLKEDDEVIAVLETTGKEELFIATKNGYGLWFSEQDVSPVGQRAAGVKAINLQGDDVVVDASTFSLDDKVEFFLATHRGAVKRMAITEFKKMSRAGRGTPMLRTLKHNPHRVIGCKRVMASDDVFVIETERGEFVEVYPAAYRRTDRHTNGSYVYDDQEKGVAQTLKRVVPTVD